MRICIVNFECSSLQPHHAYAEKEKELGNRVLQLDGSIHRQFGTGDQRAHQTARFLLLLRQGGSPSALLTTPLRHHPRPCAGPTGTHGLSTCSTSPGAGCRCARRRTPKHALHTTSFVSLCLPVPSVFALFVLSLFFFFFCYSSLWRVFGLPYFSSTLLSSCPK